jgi:hypothetical protein
MSVQAQQKRSFLRQHAQEIREHRLLIFYYYLPLLLKRTCLIKVTVHLWELEGLLSCFLNKGTEISAAKSEIIPKKGKTRKKGGMHFVDKVASTSLGEMRAKLGVIL